MHFSFPHWIRYCYRSISDCTFYYVLFDMTFQKLIKINWFVHTNVLCPSVPWYINAANVWNKKHELIFKRVGVVVYEKTESGDHSILKLFWVLLTYLWTTNKCTYSVFFVVTSVSFLVEELDSKGNILVGEVSTYM